MVMATHGITLFNANASIFIPPPSPPYTLRTVLADSIRCRFSALPSISLHLNSAPKGLRRHLLVSATSLWGAVTSLMGANSGREAALAVKRGMQLFVQGDVQESVVEFDKALELDPRQKAYLWQRGLSLYYLNRFEEGAAQFREDVAANPNDTEESIWCFLCEARLYGVDEARRRFLEVGPDPRPVMRKAYEMFKNGGKPDELIAEFSNGTEHDYFYATLYAGLYHEVQALALSTAEAEYRALVEAGKEALWLKSLLNEIDLQIVDILTKSLTKAKFLNLRDLLQIKEVSIKGGSP